MLKLHPGMKTVNVIYKHLPDRVQRYPQVLLHECDEAIVSLDRLMPYKPIVAEGSVLVERGDFAVWFIFPNAWYDTGVVYDSIGRFKGYYCDILKPVERRPDGYETTDLFLDLWVFPDGRYVVLDREEFDEALKQGWLAKPVAERAENELQRLTEDVEKRSFPKPIVRRLGGLPEDARSLLEAIGKG